MHLDANNLVLDTVSKDDLYRLMVRMASHSLARPSRSRKREGRASPKEEIDAIGQWLRTNARKIRKGERSITFGQLYRILEKFGYRLGHKRNNKVEILKERRKLFRTKWLCVYKAPCPGDARIVPLNEIKTLRESLGLTEANGVDSESFYETQMIIDSFIRTHRNVLRKLAKT